VEGAEAIVAKHYEKDFFAPIPQEVVLVPQPTTSGRNILPVQLAKRISNDHGQEIFEDNVAVALARKEAKKKSGFWQKMADPVRYTGTDQTEKLKGLERPVWIVEDIHTTGESWMAFRLFLEENGIRVQGVALLAASDTRMTSADDIARLARKISEHKNGVSIDEIEGLMNSIFDGTFKHFYDKGELTLSGRDAANSAQRLLALARTRQSEGSARRRNNGKNKRAPHQRGRESDSLSLDAEMACDGCKCEARGVS
jgi:hypothetical protein